MAIPIKFWTLRKEVNSTERPAAEPAATHQCNIKAPCSILTPDIELRLPLATNNPSKLNYCYIEDWDRYYWVRDWEWSGAYWTAHCQVDVLASWRDSIGASTQYVVRSAASYDGTIADTLYPCKSIQTIEESQIDTEPWAVGLNNGTYIVGVTGGGIADPTETPYTAYYLFEPGSLQSFINYLFTDAYASQVIGNWAAVFPEFKAEFNPLQYITSVMWLPLDIDASSVNAVQVGYASVPANCKVLPKNGVIHLQMVFNLRRHPDADSRGQYLNNAPYAGYELFFPPFGLITLDGNAVCLAQQVSALCTVDLRTGNGTLNIFTDTGRILGVYHTTICVPIQVSQVYARGIGVTTMLDMGVSALKGAMSIARGVSSGNPQGIVDVAQGSADILHGIGDAVANNVPVARSIGSNGGFDALRGKVSLQYTWKRPVPDDNQHRGRPYCKRATVSSLPGYMIISDPDLDFTCTNEEAFAIRSYMTGGFYYK